MSHLVKSNCLWLTLGITISSDLRWHKHVNSVSVKATRTLNLTNIYCCLPDVKTLAYTSLIRPHLEFATAAWDPYTACDINQLDKVQHHAARFVKNDYRRTTSMSGVVRDLGWQSLENRRKNARLALFYKGLHGLSAIPCDSLRRPVRNSPLTPTHSLYFLLILIAISTRSSLEPFQNGTRNMGQSQM